MTTAVKDRPAKPAKAKPRKAASKPTRKPPTPRKGLPEPELQTLPIAALHVSALNMRHDSDEPDLDDIYPSVLERGVDSPLLVRKEGKGYGVLAGRRRLCALRRKAEETGEAQSVACRVYPSGDDALAREVSLLENTARLPATELEQFAAFKGLAEAGKAIPDIARVFGVTELRVRRVLALASLSPAILALFKSKDIDWRTLQALTLATPDQQAEWLTLFESDNYAPEGEQVKAWLTGGARIRTSAALFALDGYPGNIISDLFGGETEGSNAYFQDPDTFWQHQNPAIAARVAELKSDGWAEVVLLERGEYFERYEHTPRSQEAGGKVFVQVGHDGSVTLHEGYLSKADAKRVDAILQPGSISAQAAAKMQKPEMTSTLTEYVERHRHGAARAALLEYPGVALRLATAHMLCGSRLWAVEPQKMKARKDSTTESLAASDGAQAMDREREEVCALLGVVASRDDYGPRRIASGSVEEAFAKLVALDDATVMRVMTFAMCESLASGEDVVEALIQVIQPDMRDWWSPDDAFFAVVRDKAVINALLADIAGKRCADSMLTDTGTAQRTAIQNHLRGIAGTAQPNWRPRWMQVEAKAYLDRATCPPAIAAGSARKLLSNTQAEANAA